MKYLLVIIFSIASLSFNSKPSSVSKDKADNHIGVGAEAPEGALLMFDGSRASLDKNWEYWEGPRFAAEPPIKWEIENDPKGAVC